MVDRFLGSRLIAILALAVTPIVSGCFQVDNPPVTTIVGITDGVLVDPYQPVLLQFSEPIVPASLRVRVVRYEIDAEGYLFDEDPDPDTELTVLFDSADEALGTGTLDGARTSYSMKLPSPPPIGPQLALVIDAGLSDDKGNHWTARQVVKFGYQLSCSAGGKATKFPALGKYFWLITVDKPVPAQIQLLSEMRVEPTTGAFVIQMTNGERNKAADCAPYGLTCTATQVCRTLPTPACASPSEKAGTVDEYVDFIADADSDVGFSFTIEGCIVDQPDGTFAFANLPADAITKKPAVVVSGINLSTSWQLDAKEVLRGAGTFSAEQVGLGSPPNTVPSGKGIGSHAERKIPDDFAPPIPSPPAD